MSKNLQGATLLRLNDADVLILPADTDVEVMPSKNTQNSVNS